MNHLNGICVQVCEYLADLCVGQIGNSGLPRPALHVNSKRCIFALLSTKHFFDLATGDTALLRALPEEKAPIDAQTLL